MAPAVILVHPPGEQEDEHYNNEYSETEEEEEDDNDETLENYEQAIRATMGLNSRELDYLFSNNDEKREKDSDYEDDSDNSSKEEDEEENAMSFTSSVSSFRRQLLQQQQNNINFDDEPSALEGDDESEEDDHDINIIVGASPSSSQISATSPPATRLSDKTTNSALEDWNQKLVQNKATDATPSRLFSRLQEIQEKQRRRRQSLSPRVSTSKESSSLPVTSKSERKAPKTTTRTKLASSPQPKWQLQSLYQNTPSKLLEKTPTSLLKAPSTTPQRKKLFASKLQTPSPARRKTFLEKKSVSTTTPNKNNDESIQFLRSAIRSPKNKKNEVNSEDRDSPSESSELLVDDWLTTKVSESPPTLNNTATSSSNPAATMVPQQDYLVEKERRIELQAQVEQLLKQTQTVSPRIATLQRLETLNQELESRLQTELQQANDKYMELRDKLEQERKDHQQAVEEASAKYTALETQYEEDRKSHQETLEAANNKYQALENQRDKERQTHQETLEAADFKYQALEKQHEKELSETLEATNAKYNVLQVQYQKDTEALSATLQRSTQEMARKHKQEMLQLTQELEDVNDKYEDLEEQHQKERVSDRENAQLELENTTQLLEAVNAKHQRVEESLRNEKQELVEELDCSNVKFQELLTRHGQETTSLREELAASKTAHQEIKTSLEDKETEWTQERQQADQRHAELQEMLQSKETDDNKIQEYYVKQLELVNAKCKDLEETLRQQQDESRLETEDRQNYAHQLEIANAEYKELEEKYTRETKEWQLLLEAEINSRGVNGSSNNDISGEEKQQLLEVIEQQPTDQDTFDKEHAVNPLVPFDEDNSQLSPIPKRLSGLQVFGLNDDEEEDPSLGYSSAGDDAPIGEKTNSMERLDNLLDELGQMDVERAALLNEINTSDSSLEQTTTPTTTTDIVPISSPASPDQDYSDSDVGNNKYDPDSGALVEATNKSMDDSKALDQTITLLHNLKDLMKGNGEESDKETSIMEQLEALSEMMQDDAASEEVGNILALYQEERSREEENRLMPYVGSDELVETSLLNNSKGDNSAMESSFQSMSSQSRRQRRKQSAGDYSHDFYSGGDDKNPWPQLVAALRQKIHFLENDRNELARITHVMLTCERESHAAKLEAAVATAQRESTEHLELYKQQVNHRMKHLYASLCLTCQRRIYTATT